MSRGDDADESLFQAEMAGVKPLKSDLRVRLAKGQVPSDVAARRDNAVADTRDPNPLSDADIEWLDPWVPLEFKRPGIQHGVFRKLKLGQYAIEARLDLHGMNVPRARQEVWRFIEDSVRYELRSLLIIHGRGKTSGERRAVLKSYLNRWLPELESVQGFASAQPHHGGTGAVYVLLKKGELSKRENRTRFSKGRVDPQG